MLSKDFKPPYFKTVKAYIESLVNKSGKKKIQKKL